ncbi:hypothetical protein [Natrinema versiforme]|uniref:hypothetical protein n=1 Tax=Natrinema versiforme TaxID=88724 RepID=UPI00126813B7|nr:hypothetical protein [Natrinema versiforme]
MASDTVSGYVQLKSIEGWRLDGSNETVLDIAYSDREESVAGHVYEPWTEYVDDPDRPTVSETFHDELRQTYDQLWYVIGVCSDQWDTGDSTGCRNDFTDRNNFNQAQVYDRVEASYSKEDEYIEIHDVTGTQTPAETQ